MACAIAAIGCSAPAPPFERIVFVSIDTLRADHLGSYGYTRPISPFIDRTAAAGVLFERAYASMPTTVPSHATMFTGLPPILHGVLRNGRRLADERITLAERLAARGFVTAGFSGTRAHFSASNLDQGFSHFDERPRGVGGVYRPADQTLQAARDWLRDQPNDRPLFLLLHLFDVHHPWDPPEVHLREVVRLSKEAGFDLNYWTHAQHIPLEFYSNRVEKMRRTIDAYDAEIHFCDAELGRFADDFAAWADGQPTLWIVTSDHGEGLGNHDWLFHGKHIYDEQVHVPLIVYASDHRFAPRRVDSIVRHVDLMPTILELASGANGARSEATAPVEDDVQTGRSLASWLRGSTPEPSGASANRTALIQRRSFDPNPAADARAQREGLSPDNRYEPGQTFGWIDSHWKLIHRTIGEDELFDVASDPYETRNLATEQPQQLARMRSALDAKLAELEPRAPAAAAAVSAETRRRLDALGYLP